MKKNTFAMVLPYYNELDYIRATLESCLAQRRLPDQLILVDNASTDGSEQLCREVLKDLPTEIEVVYVRESQPGCLFALIAGLRHVDCEFTSIWNADTIYPPQYFAECERIFRAGPKNLVAVMAKGIYAAPDAWSSRHWRYTYHFLQLLRPKMSFTGGYGQTFRTEALRTSGGYSADIWPYLLEDHEIIHRVCKQGICRSSPNHWCLPSARRQDRAKTSWNLTERIVYFLTPHVFGDWFFYRFLGPRFKRRQIMSVNLRQRDWDASAPAPPSSGESLSPPPPSECRTAL